MTLLRNNKGGYNEKILKKIQSMLLWIWLLGVPAVTLLVSGIEENSDLGRSAGRLFFLWLVITVFVEWFIDKCDDWDERDPDGNEISYN